MINNICCDICYEQFNKNTHKEINCIYCNKIACKSCVQEYLLNYGFQDCLFCKKDFPLSFLYSNFTKKWCNEIYLSKYAEICFQLERQHFLTQTINSPNNKKQTYELKIKTLLTQCPNNLCNGEIINENNKLICNICKQNICKKCYKFKPKLLKNKDNIDENKHKCDNDDLSNVIIAKSSKNCPNCKIIIFKTSGCDHMFCTQCHTMFNWSDLKITKTTTNPHYYEWLRSQGITPTRSDVVEYNCNEILSRSNCYDILKSHNLTNEYILINSANLLHELKQKPISTTEMNNLRIE